jgi:hypothetical protein
MFVISGPRKVIRMAFLDLRLLDIRSISAGEDAVGNKDLTASRVRPGGVANHGAEEDAGGVVGRVR